MRHAMQLLGVVLVLAPGLLGAGCSRKDAPAAGMAARGPMANRYDAKRRRGMPQARPDGGTP